MEKLSKNWKDLGNINEKVVSFSDDIIPTIDLVCDISKGVWILLEGELYHFKTRKEWNLLCELLGEGVSEYFGLSTIHHELARGDYHGYEYYGVLSKWGRKEESHYTELKKVMPYCKNLEILAYLDSYYPNEPILTQFRAFLVRDYFTNEYDRISSEIILEETDSIHSLGYLTDYECEFKTKKESIAVSSLYSLPLRNFYVVDAILKDETLLQYFRKALNINLLEILEQVKEKHDLNLRTSYLEKIQTFESRQKDTIRKCLHL